MNKEIKKDLLEEGIRLLEEWAKKTIQLPPGSQLVVNMSIRDVDPVILKIEDQRSSSRIDEILARPLKDLQLEIQTHNTLKNTNFYIIGDVARFDESNYLKLKSFGTKSLRDVKSKLENLGLKIGMDIPVGDLERKALLECPIDGYVTHLAIPKFKSREIITVADFLKITHVQFVTTFGDIGPKEFGMPVSSVYGWVRRAMEMRGIFQ